jgi:Fanconi anemia group M protein
MVREKALEDREYQRRMVKRSPQANTLVVLPTALGKTIIAELVAAESDKLLTPNVTSGC